jgi:hypothetical protein
MHNNKEIVERRAEMFKSQLDKARDDYKNNLCPNLQSFELRPLTKVVLETIQREVNSFLERNELAITVYVEPFEEGIYLMGRTLIDEIVWINIYKEK